MRKRFFAVFLLLLLLFAASALADSDENLLQNPDFEELGSDGLPTGWTTEAYYPQEGYSLFMTCDDEPDRGNYVSITNLAGNDARFAQTVAVEPESMYCLSGWVKAEEVPDAGRGVNLSVADIYAFSESVYGSSDWTYIEYYGETGPDQTEITVFARLGGYGGESRGSASFDGLSLKKVDTLPEGVVADLWFSLPQESVQAVDVEEEETGSFRTGLYVLALVCLVLGLCTLPALLKQEASPLAEKKRLPWVLVLGLLLAAVTRIIIGLRVEGYQVDVGCFRSWGSTMASVGASNFYEATSFCDYPPAYVYVLGLCASLINALGSVNAAFIYKLVPMACDLAAAGLIYRFARREKMGQAPATLLALWTAFNPAILLNSAAWCQMDSVLCLSLMLVAWLAIQGKWIAVMPVYMLAVLIKPQALMLGPLGLTAIVLEWIKNPRVRRAMLIGCGAAVALALVILTPFSLHQSWDWLIQLYSRTLASYPYATVNTANFWYLFNGNWAAIEGDASRIASLLLGLMCLGGAFLLFRKHEGRKLWQLEPAALAAFALFFLVLTFTGATWQTLGIAAMVLAFAITLPAYLRGGSLRLLPLCGGALFTLLYVFGIKMHERYLFPALFLLAMAFLLHRDRRILGVLLLTSLTVFLNEGIVLDNSLCLGSSLGHLNQDTRGIAMVLSGINVIAALLAAWTCWDVAAEGRVLNGTGRLLSRLPNLPLAQAGCDPLTWKPRPEEKYTRKEILLVAAVTLAYAVLAFCNLGSTKAPQNPWKSTAYEETVTLDLGESVDSFRVLYFAQVSYSDFSLATSEDGVSWTEEHWAQMAQGSCYQWKYVSCYNENDAGERTYFSTTPYTFSGRYLRISAQQVGLILDEILLRDDAGNTIPATVYAREGANSDSPLYSDPAALLDEQDTLDGEPSWYNSTYFDEIYYARTGYELLHGTTPYETTHPPLGKLLMSLCIAIFDMTPFGWRFAGCLMGVLMLPLMYALGRRLCHRPLGGVVAMLMMTLDCMHLTQTRLCTIDSFPVFFILLSFFFMLRFMQQDLVKAPLKQLNRDLALSGLSIGLACASKWIGAYAAVGLAELYFWTCGRHLYMARKARLRLEKGGLSPEEKELLTQRSRGALDRVLTLCLWCLLFFVVVPVTVYVLCYIPYFAYTRFTGIGDFLKAVWQAQVNMLNYHSTPGLGMDHPFYSPWYEWPLIQRPMYYASPQFPSDGRSYAIFSFGNPAVWWFGLVGLAFTLAVWGRNHLYRRENGDSLLHWESASPDVSVGFILLGLLAQFLPWVLVPRGTYIYHYFASVPFLCMATALLFTRLTEKRPRAGRIAAAVYLVICLVCFIGFYPYASGVEVSTGWLDFMKQFLHVYY